MEDPFSYITKYSTISNSQAEILHRCDFNLEDLPLQENSSASEATPVDRIIICSAPRDSMVEDEVVYSVQQEVECYHTPDENLSIQDSDEQDGMRIDGVGGDSSVAVDLGGDTDLLMPENGASTEIVDETDILSKNEVLIGESSAKGELGIVKLEKDDFVMNNVVDDSGGVEERRDEETENDHVFSGDVEMDDSPLVLGNDPSSTHVVDSAIPENSQREEAEKDLENGISNTSDTVEVQDKFEINDSNGVCGNLVAGVPQGVRILPDWNDEFARRDDGRGGVIGGRVDGLSSGREEQRLAGVGSSAQEPEIPCEANAQPAHVTGVARNSSGENSAQQFVNLSDLISVDDNDILAVAIKAGMKFPRPRWWRPEGYARANSQPLN